MIALGAFVPEQERRTLVHSADFRGHEAPDAVSRHQRGLPLRIAQSPTIWPDSA
jgi:hypothetical protein